MAGKKKQVVALIDPELLTGLDTLRIITRESRARVLENVLHSALHDVLAKMYPDRDRVFALAARAGLTLEQYVEAYAAAFSSGAYGPGLDALELDDRMVTGKRAKPTPIVHAAA